MGIDLKSGGRRTGHKVSGWDVEEKGGRGGGGYVGGLGHCGVPRDEQAGHIYLECAVAVRGGLLSSHPNSPNSPTPTHSHPNNRPARRPSRATCT